MLIGNGIMANDQLKKLIRTTMWVSKNTSLTHWSGKPAWSTATSSVFDWYEHATENCHRGVRCPIERNICCKESWWIPQLSPDMLLEQTYDVDVKEENGLDGLTFSFAAQTWWMYTNCLIDAISAQVDAASQLLQSSKRYKIHVSRDTEMVLGIMK